MRVIEPSYEILSDSMSPARRIECAGRTAYKSEDKITEESAGPFAEKMIEHGHWPVLDMGVFHIILTMPKAEYSAWMANANYPWAAGKYIFFDKLKEEGLKRQCLLTGSPRALTEYLNKLIWRSPYANCLAVRLYMDEPSLFSGLRTIPGFMSLSDDECTLNNTYLTCSSLIDEETYKRHRHVSVKFTINRAVSHEMVRHRPAGFLQESQRYCRYSLGKFGNEVTFIRPCFYKEGSLEYSLWERAMKETEQIYFDLLKTSSPQAARTVLPNSCKTELFVHTNLKHWEHILRLRTSEAADPSMREVMIPLMEEMKELYPVLDLEAKPYSD